MFFIRVEKLASAVRETGVPRHRVRRINAPPPFLEPHNAIVLCWSEGFQGSSTGPPHDAKGRKPIGQRMYYFSSVTMRGKRIL